MDHDRAGQRELRIEAELLDGSAASRTVRTHEVRDHS
jgi:hypothetical protein